MIINDAAAKIYLEELIKYIGDDPKREGLIETPKRILASWREIFSGYNVNAQDFIKTFDSERYDELVLVSNISFYSTCEHHLLPFFGKCHVAYIVGDSLLGLSKLPRFVEMFSRRLQNQERLTTQIASAIDEYIKPKGVGVIISAKHFCMCSRGIKNQTSIATTSCLLGCMKNPGTRSEFLSLIELSKENE